MGSKEERETRPGVVGGEFDNWLLWRRREQFLDVVHEVKRSVRDDLIAAVLPKFKATLEVLFPEQSAADVLGVSAPDKITLEKLNEWELRVATPSPQSHGSRML